MTNADSTAPGQGRPRIALVLPGGGARSAYQVGVLKAIAGWCKAGAPLPFSILCGTSAGAINAAVIGAGAGDFQRSSAELERVWSAFRIDQVFRSGALDMLRSGLHLLLALVSGGWLLAVPKALFDNAPLRSLLAREIDFARISQAIGSGALDAIAVTATGLGVGESVTFVQTAQSFAALATCRPARRRRGYHARSPDGELRDSAPVRRRADRALPFQRWRDAPVDAARPGHPPRSRSHPRDRRAQLAPRSARCPTRHPTSARCSVSCWTRCSWRA